MKFEKITKIEAAERQLKEAIRLSFERRDKLAIHTLAGAAHEILKDLGKKKGVTGLIKNVVGIKEDKRTEYFRLVNHPKNFLKHANRDSENELDFNQMLNEVWLCDAIYLCEEITGKISHEMRIFRAWFMSKHPELSPMTMEQELEVMHSYKEFEDYEFWLKLLDNKK